MVFGYPPKPIFIHIFPIDTHINIAYTGKVVVVLYLENVNEHVYVKSIEFLDAIN